jgi:hypothetical protein
MKSRLFLALALSILAAVAIALSGWYVVHNTKPMTVTVKVTHKAIEGEKGTYMVYTDHGAFTDNNDYLHAKFDSSDLYNRLVTGRTYKCAVYGGRIPLLSGHPNLLRCEQMKA